MSQETGTRITFNNILYLTDFSEPSEIALPFAAAIARHYDAHVFALHVLLPNPYISTTPELTAEVVEEQERSANAQMQRVGSRLSGLAHEVVVERGLSVSYILQYMVQRKNIDLIVLGTHGRTGAQRMLLGSIAEEVFRNSKVPVLTIGPSGKSASSEATLRCVLFATDFTPASLAAAPYAFSIAQENQARLVLLHVISQIKKEEMLGQLSVADAMHHLHKAIPDGADLWCRPEQVVEYGVAAERIVEVAHTREADLIVLGLRPKRHLGFETHFGRTTAHEVVAKAACPVLTVRN